MTTWTPDQPILEIENLSISFFTRLREIPAVMDFSCTVMPGEAMGLVGESGCGKSTVALAVMRDLGVNGRIVGGSIRFKGRDLTNMSQEDLRGLRGSEIAMIYQEPMASLNPAMKIGAQLAEVPMIHGGMSRSDALALARQLVADVRLPDPDRALREVERRYADRAEEVDHHDGLSMSFDGWRFNLRRSDTEPLLRLNVEALAGREKVQRAQAEMAVLLASC